MLNQSAPNLILSQFLFIIHAMMDTYKIYSKSFLQIFRELRPITFIGNNVVQNNNLDNIFQNY